MLLKLGSMNVEPNLYALVGMGAVLATAGRG
jgi:hypothetical protein